MMNLEAVRPYARGVAIALMLGLLALGLYFAGRWWSASLLSQAARLEMDQWTAQETLPSADALEKVGQQLQSAIRLAPRVAEYHRLLALLHEWQSYSYGDGAGDDQAILAARDQAVVAYRQAASRRPAWPAGWSHLARMKVLAGEVDDEFARALHNAARLGPADRSVQREIDFVFASLDRLSLRQRVCRQYLSEDAPASLRSRCQPQG